MIDSYSFINYSRKSIALQALTTKYFRPGVLMIGEEKMRSFFILSLFYRADYDTMLIGFK